MMVKKNEGQHTRTHAVINVSIEDTDAKYETQSNSQMCGRFFPQTT